MVRENFKFTCFKWVKMMLNYPPWFGEIFEIHLSQMAKNDLKFSTMVGKRFEIYYPQMAKNDFFHAII